MWQKHGLLIKPQKQFWWMKTHAMLPTVDDVDGGKCRIYFSGRDRFNRSHIGYVVFDLNHKKVMNYSKEPVLSPGDLGCFDDNGVTPSWIVNLKQKKYLYYIGWKPRSTTRMSLVMGLAVSKDQGKTFKRYTRAPLLGLTDKEPYSILTAPCILKEARRWRMWYVSGLGWKDADLPIYDIKYAESKDGIDWKREGKVCIKLKNKEEEALARPCVIKEGGIYRMWYAHKGKTYRLGYAESKDGLRWRRKDELVGISKSKTGWDTQMMEYAYIFDHGGKRHMFYNGNDYGKQGIGYATQEL